ncbi:family 43 glycosylhydrolase [Anseongella ginsenosidimutans]|uniref:family 43 glycosylhydrolase n=1 Tax=Anseongella ginsenosidimutans TaxID=496056 RepID=UPI00131525AE|nr:family 43 glycosylhydrolase [Anseongella ginsenosidimutans]
MTVYNSLAQDTANIPNPVLPGVADAGVLHYNGEYYIGGVSTKGSFYVSPDLVNWEGPYHVFSMDNDWTEGPSADDSQIHASDIHYLNGVFHHYWSVNYWGKDHHVVHIGHAVSPDVLGPYKEPVKETWLANRIDPHLFRDKDGKLYLYMVKFTDGNTIWARPMKDPASFSGAPRYLFASLPGTWETRDNRVAEGPWVVRYRGQYYLMYNANHTSPDWGNYTLGVAQADGPMEFNHGSKYPHPVVQSNQEDLEDIYPDLLRSDPETEGSSQGPTRVSVGLFLYTADAPGENWNQLSFDDSAWLKGMPGLGSAPVKNSTTRQVRTAWKTEKLWLRKTFSVEKEKTGNLSLRIHHDGATRVFLNGTLIYSDEGRQYRHWNFDREATALLKDGKNLLAIESSAGHRSGFLDVSLFDMKDRRADDILFSPGQPNILRGPNGFEWWLIYMANKNAERRGQYINRVHFFDKKLVVDGITAGGTPGYHAVPAAPTFGDLFNGAGKAVKEKWKILSGSWKQENKELVLLSADPATALPLSQPSTHYLFEAGVKIIADHGRAGIYAWRKDEDNWMKILLDRKARKWALELRKAGETQTASYPLPDNFNYEAYHKLTVFKNAGEFRVLIDGLPAPGQYLFNPSGQPGTEFPGKGLFEKGLPGLYAEAAAAFDGILYTIGWDEFDTQITGWKTASGTIAEADSWHLSEEGIGPARKEGRHSVFKGDPVNLYEFSLQVTFAGGKEGLDAHAEAAENPAQNPNAGANPDAGAAGKAGIYAVYVDDANYIKALFDAKARQLLISGRKNGKPLKTHRLSLETSRPLYADMKYSDFIEKHFTFDSPAWINALRFSKTPHGQPDTLIEDIHRKMDIFFRQGGRWYPLDGYREIPSTHPGFEEIGFEPVRATALKLVNKQAGDHHFYTYKLWTRELFRESSHVRVVKLSDSLIFLVNGEEIFRMSHDFPASRVGLTAVNALARFNGITFFRLKSR